jgi:hypothetical protein
MTELPPEARLWNLMRGAMTTKALGVAADLGVADALADGPRPVAELALEVGADRDTLHRILRALASDGVFTEDEPGVFGHTDASQLLRSGAPGAWPEFAHLFSGIFAKALAELDPRTNEGTFTRGFETDFWSWLAQNPEERTAFDAAMAGGKERARNVSPASNGAETRRWSTSAAATALSCARCSNDTPGSEASSSTCLRPT